MRLSMNWLREYGLQVSADDLARYLTMAGLEVDSLQPAAPMFHGVVVGEVIALRAHPDADKLRIAMVLVGQDETLQIVCGASNVALGIKVPTALVGAVLPNGLAIQESLLRGVASYGMLCSARELGLSDDHAGLMILPSDAPIGVDVRDFLGLSDTILDIDLTPNRADAFSMRGLAREAGVLLAQDVNLALPQRINGGTATALHVRNEVPQACPLYLVREIRGVDVSRPTPLWLSERLRRAGIRPHDAVVDVTNYVMMSLGTPMHAFDAAAIEGDIVIRFADDGEKLTLLNGQEAALDESVLLIADHVKPLAMAGVMGGAESACDVTTRDIVLEAAWFDPVCIAGKARNFGLASDSAQRFERGVDFSLQHDAMSLATRLICEICGGDAHEVVADEHQHYLPRRNTITLYRAAIARRIGRTYDDVLIESILRRLGCEVYTEKTGWQVTPPSWRFDLSIADDLIEEIVRVDGYENVLAVVPTVTYSKREEQDDLRSHAEKLIAAGCHEAITYSFIDHDMHQLFFPRTQAIRLQNPISTQLAEMRLSLLPGLVNALAYNRNRQQQDVRLFEVGKVFLPKGEKAVECLQEQRVAAVMCGRVYPEQWAEDNRMLDFYHLKGMVESLLDNHAVYRPTSQNWLHPGQGADILVGGEYVGCLGALHPEVQEKIGIKGQPIWLFELRSNRLQTASVPQFMPINKYPTVRRDLSLIVDKSVAAADIETVIRDKVGNNLAEFFFFDQYEGKPLAANQKSLALAIVLQAYDKTLQDEEVERMIAVLIEELQKIFNAELR